MGLRLFIKVSNLLDSCDRKFNVSYENLQSSYKCIIIRSGSRQQRRRNHITNKIRYEGPVVFSMQPEN